jgi:hypothetical protein
MFHNRDDLRIMCLSPSGKIKAIENTGCRDFRKQHADIVAALKNGGGIVGGRCFNNLKAFPLKGIGCHGANVRIGLYNENNSLGGGFYIVHGDRDTQGSDQQGQDLMIGNCAPRSGAACLSQHQWRSEG